ncbi:hypothetical protein [Paenibacillus herberti]|uniref:Uncharacterized protein n=1 Tax=Paenibacillus herberti TaxID=1619309 RepID=A0A229NTX0_9BACL|nr:hypothetical protein [Paenibacillus herberti]OXM13353.1 hypothetical protein CGZ75_20010 [Paenibacillus herberti]
MEQAKVSQVLFPRLTLFSDESFNGQFVIGRGNLGIRNLENIFDGPESLRFLSDNRNACLVLFTRTAFRGNFRIYLGPARNLPELEDLLRGEDVESLISSNQRLSVAQVRLIRLTGVLPAGFRIV